MTDFHISDEDTSAGAAQEPDSNIDSEEGAPDTSSSPTGSDGQTGGDSDSGIGRDTGRDTGADMDTSGDAGAAVDTGRDSEEKSGADDTMGRDGGADAGPDAGRGRDTDSQPGADTDTGAAVDRTCPEPPPCVRFVDGRRAGDGSGADGRAWETAFSSVQDGIDSAAAAGGGCEVWVAEGTHYLYRTDPSDGIRLADGVALLGGFETSDATVCDRDSRSSPAGRTVLSGCADPACMDRVHHVLVGADNARIDGFVIERGLALRGDGAGLGGGMLNVGVSGVVIDNCIFRDNEAERGGAMYNDSSALTVRNTIFLSNTASRSGGAVFNQSSDPAFDKAVFLSNAALGTGGGLSNVMGSTPFVDDSVFVGNRAGEKGAGIYSEHTRRFITIRDSVFSGHHQHDDVPIRDAFVGGGVYGYNAEYRIVSSIFTANSADEGSAVFITRPPSQTDDRLTLLTGSVFFENLAGGDQRSTILIEGYRQSLAVANCTISGNSDGIVVGYNNASSLTIENTVAHDNPGGDLALRGMVAGGIIVRHSFMALDGIQYSGDNNRKDDPLLSGFGRSLFPQGSAVTCAYDETRHRTAVTVPGLSESGIADGSLSRLVLMKPLGTVSVDLMPATLPLSSRQPRRTTGVWGPVADNEGDTLYIIGDYADEFDPYDCDMLDIYDYGPAGVDSPVIDWAYGPAAPERDIHGRLRVDVEGVDNMSVCEAGSGDNCVLYADSGAVEFVPGAASISH